MTNKTTFPLMIFLLSITTFLKSQTTGSSTTEIILSNATARAFSTKPVSDSEIDLIVRCGMQATSARNSQPWKFTVVQDHELISQIIPNTTQGNVLIVISGMEEQGPGMAVDFDCGLATQNMYITGQSLGLGAHIYMSPVSNINTSLRKPLDIPEGYRAIAVLRIGNLDPGVDALSGASTRKKPGEVVTYK
jgi:nitroreductase